MALLFTILIVCFAFQFRHALKSDSCPKCSEAAGFMCHDEYTYSFCIDGIPENQILTCRNDQVCSTAKILEFCYDRNSLASTDIDCYDDGISAPIATTPNTPAAPTTPTTTSPSAFCRDKKPGLHAYTGDTACKKYYSCYPFRRPAIFSCPGQNVFNPIVQRCVAPWGYQCRTQNSPTTQPRPTMTSGTDADFCLNKQPGLYAYNGDTTCKTYYSCNTSRNAVTYSCSGQNVFNPAVRMCVAPWRYSCRT